MSGNFLNMLSFKSAGLSYDTFFFFKTLTCITTPFSIFANTEHADNKYEINLSCIS